MQKTHDLKVGGVISIYGGTHRQSKFKMATG